jgi:hypothetical protein
MMGIIWRKKICQKPNAKSDQCDRQFASEKNELAGSIIKPSKRQS